MPTIIGKAVIHISLYAKLSNVMLTSVEIFPDNLWLFKAKIYGKIAKHAFIHKKLANETSKNQYSAHFI
ncbi:hypothetical protein NBRC116600_05490 [Thalassotalea sp. SU-HH00458]